MKNVVDEPKPDIEARLERVEGQIAHILGSKKVVKDWESTVGMWKDDEMSREIDELGRQWRVSVTD